METTVEVSKWKIQTRRVNCNHGTIGCWKKYTVEYFGGLRVSESALLLTKFKSMETIKTTNQTL